MKRDVTGMRLAEGPKHLDPVTARHRRRLPGRAALADARRSHHVHDATAAIDRAVHHGVKGRHLPTPTDQARLGAPDQPIARADRHQPARAHRLVGALDAHPLRFTQHARSARPAAPLTPTASPRPGAPPIPSAAQTRPAHRSRCSPATPNRSHRRSPDPNSGPPATAAPRHRAAAPRPPADSPPAGWPARPDTPETA